MKKLQGVALVVIAVIAIGGSYVFPKIKEVKQPLGNAGVVNTDGQEFFGGAVWGKVNSTSTTATTQTLAARDLVGADGFAFDTVLFTPNTGNTTLTLPASSTLRHFLPQPGQRAKQCWVNSTSTASVTITFAAGTGIDLETVATSTTAGTAGVVAVNTGQGVCFDFIRKAATASAYDISALMTLYRDAD